MLKFGHSRLMALGDFKRTWRDDKTTCGVFSAKCQESPHLQVGEYVNSEVMESGNIPLFPDLLPPLPYSLFPVTYFKNERNRKKLAIDLASTASPVRIAFSNSSGVSNTVSISSSSSCAGSVSNLSKSLAIKA